MKEVYEYLKNCGVFYLATTEGDQPRVRPFGAIDIFEDKFYFQTGKIKEVYKQLVKNPKIEISAMSKAGTWIRLEAQAFVDDRIEAKQHMLDENPSLKSRYAADDGNTAVFYLKDATATIYAFTGEPKVIKF